MYNTENFKVIYFYYKIDNTWIVSTHCSHPTQFLTHVLEDVPKIYAWVILCIVLVYSLAESITTNLRICHTWMCTILSTLTSLYLRRMLFKIKRFLFNESKNITSKYVAFSDNFLLAYLFNKQIVRIYIVSCTVDVNIEFYYFFLSQN